MTEKTLVERLSRMIADVERIDDGLLQWLPSDTALLREARAAMSWRSIETRPEDRHCSYLVTNAKGDVCPWVDGVIINNVGSQDWHYGEAVTAWMPLPPPPTKPEGAL